MVAHQFPAAGLGPQNEAWRKEVESSINYTDQRIDKMTNDTSNSFLESRSSMRLLTAQVASLQTTVAFLQSLTDVQYAEFVTAIGPVAAIGDVNPGIGIALDSVPTGRIEITFGGTLNSGSGYFLYEVLGSVSGTIISRASIMANPARRVAVTGGASFAPSGSNSVVINVPTNQIITVNLWLNAANAGVVFFGGSLLVRVSP